jgi:uncharacterized protein
MTVELAWLAVSVMIAGVLTGVLAGLFGIGGGALIVPVLFEAFRLLGVPETVRMQLCIGTSLAIIVPTTIRSYRAHKERGVVLTDVLRRWTVPAVAGVAVGTLLAAFAPSGVFEAAFVLIVCLIAAKLLFGAERWAIGAELPGAAAMTSYGFAIGLGSSLMGISGGSLVTMILSMYRVPILNGVATASGLGVPITLAGAIGYVIAGLSRRAELPPLSIGFVSLIGVVMVAPLSSWTAPLGARLAHRLPRRTLEVAFAVYLLLAAARFAVNLLVSAT